MAPFGRLGGSTQSHPRLVRTRLRAVLAERGRYRLGALAMVVADILDLAEVAGFGRLAKAPQSEKSDCGGPCQDHAGCYQRRLESVQERCDRGAVRVPAQRSSDYLDLTTGDVGTQPARIEPVSGGEGANLAAPVSDDDAGRDRAEDCQPHRSSDLAAGVEQPGANAGRIRWHLSHGSGRASRDHESETDTYQHIAHRRQRE